MTAYEQGYRAWLDGHSLATNPYWPPRPGAGEWANGWHAAAAKATVQRQADCQKRWG